MYNAEVTGKKSNICKLTLSSGHNEWKQVSAANNHDIIYPLNGTHIFVTSYDYDVPDEEMAFFNWASSSADWGKFRKCNLSSITLI